MTGFSASSFSGRPSCLYSRRHVRVELLTAVMEGFHWIAFGMWMRMWIPYAIDIDMVALSLQGDSLSRSPHQRSTTCLPLSFPGHRVVGCRSRSGFRARQIRCTSSNRCVLHRYRNQLVPHLVQHLRLRTWPLLRSYHTVAVSSTCRHALHVIIWFGFTARTRAPCLLFCTCILYPQGSCMEFLSL